MATQSTIQKNRQNAPLQEHDIRTTYVLITHILMGKPQSNIELKLIHYSSVPALAVKMINN